MSKKKFTEEEIAVLAANPYTFCVSPGQISYTREFKQLFWSDYQNRLKPTEIFCKYGYDPAILGQERISGFQRSLKEEAERGLDFYDGRFLRGRQEEQTDTGSHQSTTIRDVQHRLSYLEQEVDFLKKFHQSEPPKSRWTAHE